MLKDIQKYYYAKNWYTEANKLIRQIYGDDAFLFIDLLAAISPQIGLAANWTMANRIYQQYKAGQDVKFNGLWKSHIRNVKRALARQPLSGNKVKAFAENLKGNLDTVTIDTWMMRYLGWFKIRPKRNTPTNKQYAELSKRISRAAKKHNLKPAELQAILWTAIRDRNEYNYIDINIICNERNR